MKITSWFTQAILGVNYFLFSDEHNQIYKQKCPGSSKLYSGWDFEAEKVLDSSGGWIKAFWNESMRLCKYPYLRLINRYL